MAIFFWKAQISGFKVGGWEMISPKCTPGCKNGKHDFSCFLALPAPVFLEWLQLLRQVASEMTSF